ncbi:alkaline phosphatase family protein [Luteolibacter arcticus]|uniref:Alkaline phosphatase family protein n=1 Tax=Luteolibacter arcticus TaxID=1581411 RepID=A0ABT3GQF8_9BACT|nr:alkaline phosphatase family protein [Luteolibacter arcticus]MCW1925746.1 alkaline phosphatase family protein [Luteolibacter arcticus]
MSLRVLFVALLAGTCVAAPGPGAAGTFGPRRAMVIGIDGVRADALKKLVETGGAPHMKSLIDGGSVTWNAYAGGNLGSPGQQPTSSGPGWSSILTGTWSDKHGVTSNTFAGRNYTTYPHFFSRIRGTHPAASLSSLVVWSPIDDYIVQESTGSADFRVKSGNDILLTSSTVARLGSADPDVVFVHFDEVDHVGHASGYGPNLTPYLNAISTVDSQIGQMIAAIQARPQFAAEDWLYVITTDHGGLGTSHGGQSADERNIFIIASGGTVPSGSISRELIGHTAIPATVMRHLGLGIPASWGWESDAFQIGADLKASTGAGSVFLSWQLPPDGIAGLTGFELKRNGVTIATPALADRHFTDVPTGAPGSAVSYSIVLTGSNEAPLDVSAITPGSVPAGAAPEVHLTFDGNLNDSSGRNNHATAEGTANFTTGKSGQALSLDGTNSARIGTVAAGAPADLRFGADTDFTISFWFKANTPWTSDPGIISNKNWDSGANQGWIIAGENNGNDWQWNLKGSALTRKDFDPSNANIAGATWRLVTVVHDRDGDAIFYHDATEIGRVSIAGAGNVDTALPVRIGRDGNNGYAWAQGAFIDELKVWRRALSPAEVATEAQGNNPTGAFTAWMADQASLYAYAGTATAATDDADGDGSNNLLEYSAGTSPFRPSETPRLEVEKITSGLRVRFAQRDGGSGIHGTDLAYRAGGLRYILDRSSDLAGDWLPVQGSAVQADNESMPGVTGVHQIAVDVAATSEHEFCRLKVEFDTP